MALMMHLRMTPVAYFIFTMGWMPLELQKLISSEKHPNPTWKDFDGSKQSKGVSITIDEANHVMWNQAKVEIACICKAEDFYKTG